MIMRRRPPPSPIRKSPHNVAVGFWGHHTEMQKRPTPEMPLRNSKQIPTVLRISCTLILHLQVFLSCIIQKNDNMSQINYPQVKEIKHYLRREK